MTTLIPMLCSYQQWANNALFDRIERLDPAAQGEELQACLRLINHAYVVARIFAAHLTGTAHGYRSDTTEETPALGDLRAAFAASDRWYVDYAAARSAGELAESVSFAFTDGDRGAMTRAEMLVHVVVHACYHRAEAGRILAAASVAPPWDTLAVYLHQQEPARRAQPALSAAARRPA
ncbi:DinB family protein [Phreatobacter sp. AB_2022a]|uniref:DinB family protein n=1 Tax=Phreatobacter sp. AB_2022a TaxID=3003134 RepID=UPI0022874057|nr:DinB family protein [Phreatobacter sp. AB_2022a]MCZ0737554.1 damage-inducible protein DinB [Phreatobacter sp. AB_2022a]